MSGWHVVTYGESFISVGILYFYGNPYIPIGNFIKIGAHMGPITLGMGPPSLTADGRRRSKGPQGRHGGGFDVAKRGPGCTKTPKPSKKLLEPTKTYQNPIDQKPTKTNQTDQNLLNPTKTYHKPYQKLTKN